MITVSGASGTVLKLTNVEKVAFKDGVVKTLATGSSVNNITGTAANDTLTGTSGNDAIDGGAGIDTLQLAGLASGSVSLSKTATGWTLSGSTIGTDTLTNVERLSFADKKIALDVAPSEHAGQALEFIGVMAPSLVHTPSIVGVVLGLIDGGMNMQGVFQLAIDIGLVNDIAGSNSNAAVAQMAFRNVIGAEADAAVTDLLVSYMDGRIASYSQAAFLSTVAGMDVNQAHIGLIGLQQTGVEFS